MRQWEAELCALSGVPEVTQADREATGEGGRSWWGRQGRGLPCPTSGAQLPGAHTHEVLTVVGLPGCLSTTITEESLRDPLAPMEMGHPWVTASSTGIPPCVFMDIHLHACMVPLRNTWQDGCPSAVWGDLCSQARWGRAMHSPGSCHPCGVCWARTCAASVRSPAGSPWDTASTLRWAQGAGRLASWIYFPGNVWGHNELCLAFKCTVALQYGNVLAFFPLKKRVLFDFICCICCMMKAFYMVPNKTETYSMK